MNPTDIDWLLDTFKQVSLFSEASEKEVRTLIDHMERINFAKGETIFREGDEGQWFFIVKTGEVLVTRKKGFFGKEKVAQLGAREFFGEMALVEKGTRSATLTAEDDTVCFVLFKNKFQTMIEQNPTFESEIQRIIQERLQ